MREKVNAELSTRNRGQAGVIKSGCQELRGGPMNFKKVVADGELPWSEIRKITKVSAIEFAQKRREQKLQKLGEPRPLE